ncbi:MAG: hypothetical protein C0395_05055 [Gemmatimonas sp.]|nr:hypothetical protein [Gemmatimonas sp.]
MVIAKLLAGGILVCGLAVAGGCRGPAANSDPVALSGAPLVISDGSAKDWRALPADGVTMGLSDDDGALRLDFGFTGGGYAIARREVDVVLPENFAFSFRLRGACPVNTLEFKLVDETGENVWWRVERAIEFPAQWRTVTIKKRQLEFAWGPGGGAPLRGISAVEIVVTAAEGGTGSVWIDDLTLQELPPATAVDAAPVATATTGDAAAALDDDAETFWTPDKTDRSPALDLDFGGSREFGGLQLDWRADRHALDYVVEASDDGQTWRQLTIVSGSDGGRDHLYLPEGEARRLRLLLLRSSTKFPPELAGIAVMPLAWSRTREAFYAAVAAESPRGCYPRGISGEQVYWTVVGRDADPREVLFDEDGGLETGPYRGVVEPFLRTDGRLLTWADAETSHELVDGFLPMPSVRRRTGDLDLTVAAFVSEEPGLQGVVARYRVLNRGAVPRRVDLDLAIRPFQVNPPSQTLNRPGGAAPIRTLAQSGGVVFLDGAPAAIALTPGGRFGAVNFHGGDVVADHLRHGRLPAARSTTCEFGGASGVLSWPFDLAPGDSAEVVVLVDPAPDAPPPPPLSAAEAASFAAAAREACRRDWHARLDGAVITGPPAAREVLETLRAQLGYVLVNRAGAGIQPGTRSYNRSWIRDGSLTSWALLQMGQTAPAVDFLEWFAPHQYPDGKIPCVVDRRGADPVPEHDSSGQFIFLVAEVWRHTGDRELLQRMWPRVAAAAGYLDALRRQRRTAEWQTPDKREFFGLLPPSISHEGYSAKPMHSYWDDFFALRGFRDAAALAADLGLEDERVRLTEIHDEFAADLRASIAAAMARHGIDHVPGCADLGDFDATSTTIALTPTGGAALAPPGAIARTFEKYWEFFVDRRDGGDWDAMTPYETRTIGAFVRLGWRDRAHELVDYFLSLRRPAGWREWGEVVAREERVPRYLGDMPHTWVGTDFVRSVLDMFAYADEENGSLVIGAGVPAAWLQAGGVGVRGLETEFGSLDFTLVRDDGAVVAMVGGDLRMPPGGIVLRPPLTGPGGDTEVNGVTQVATTSGDIILTTLPATVVWRGW